jgi:hypothetical protein
MFLVGTSNESKDKANLAITAWEIHAEKAKH